MEMVVQLDGCCREVEGHVMVDLMQGRHYYIRGLVKEGGGGDYLEIGMQIEGGTKHRPIPMSLFELPPVPGLESKFWVQKHGLGL